MSTYLRLVCLDHTPPLQSEDESGQHLSDLPQIRADITRRELLVALYLEGDFIPGHYFQRATVRFLADHPACRIVIRDENGVDYGVTA